MATLLAGDIGGTKTLLSLYRHERGQALQLLVTERFRSAEWPDLGSMLQRFLLSTATTTDHALPGAACLAVAGPVQAGRASLTNLPWRLEEAELACVSGIPRLELVNDFAVLIHGLPHLEIQQQALIRSGLADSQGTRLVLGAGTGLGVALGVPTGDGLQALASEAGHGEFAATTAAEWRLRRWLLADLKLERLSIERVVSGTGLGHIARWLLSERHPNGDHPLTATVEDLPAAVAAAASRGEPLAREALDLWLAAYGRVCGDLALSGLCRGGVWLAGGTATKLLPELQGSTFVEAFLAKGRLRPVLESIPITAVIDPAIGAFSAACRARQLLEQAA